MTVPVRSDTRQAEKLTAALHYIAPRVPSSLHLRIVAAYSDFDAYRRLGKPMFGCEWRKSAEFAYPDGMTEQAWHRFTHRIWMAHQPWWARCAGRLIACLFVAREAVR